MPVYSPHIRVSSLRNRKISWLFLYMILSGSYCGRKCWGENAGWTTSTQREILVLKEWRRLWLMWDLGASRRCVCALWDWRGERVSVIGKEDSNGSKILYKDLLSVSPPDCIIDHGGSEGVGETRGKVTFPLPSPSSSVAQSPSHSCLYYPIETLDRLGLVVIPSASFRSVLLK